MSLTRQSTSRHRRNDNNERDNQGVNDDYNRHQGHHSREYREQFCRTFQTSEGTTDTAHISPRPIVPVTAPTIRPSILRPAVLRYSITGLKIPRVGSIPNTTLKMRISPGSQAHTRRPVIQQAESQIHILRSSWSIILGQPTKVTNFVDRTFPLEPITVTRTRPTATITRVDREGRAGTTTIPQDLVRYQGHHGNIYDEDIGRSNQESNDQHATEEYSNEDSPGIMSVRIMKTYGS